jgi:signal peptidase II
VRKKLLIVSIIIGSILLFDQLLKVYIKTHFLPGESVPVLGEWFLLEYIENQGMAFGTTFGSSIWGKLSLSIFRVLAIIGISYYWYKQAKKGVRLEFLIALGLVLAGAAGNLIDSMFYDFIFPVDQYLDCRLNYNQLEGSGNFADCGYFGEVELRHSGFMLGNVVDMFKFEAYWPEWMPWLGGSEVFPAIWNVADASITLGVFMILFRQRAYFPKETAASTSAADSEEQEA